MTIPNCRSVEPLYVLILRNNNQAETLFRAWIKQNRVEHATVAGNRMSLHDAYAFQKFCLTWNHDSEHLTIWDTWHKRHIYIDR